MQPGIFLLALCVVSVATVTDLRSRTIPNWLTLPLAPLALALHGLERGGSGFLFSALGALVCFLPVYYLFLREALGGGDVKLFAGLGALFGARDGLELELTAFVLVALFALLSMAWRGKLLALLSASLRASLHLLVPKRFPRPAGGDHSLELPMALAIFAATLAHAVRSLV